MIDHVQFVVQCIWYKILQSNNINMRSIQLALEVVVLKILDDQNVRTKRNKITAFSFLYNLLLAAQLDQDFSICLPYWHRQYQPLKAIKADRLSGLYGKPRHTQFSCNQPQFDPGGNNSCNHIPPPYLTES